MDKITNLITRMLRISLTILLTVMVLDVSWQVFTRFILQNPSSFTEELAGFLLIWIGLLGASYALYTKSHLGIDIMTSKLTGIRKQISQIIIHIVVILFSLFIPVIGGIRLVHITLTLRQISPALGIPMGYVYLVLPLTGFLMMYYSWVFIRLSQSKLNGSDTKTQFRGVD
jgi:TRAP-type C4-dicarboxylate transport system permease small subunit